MQADHDAAGAHAPPAAEQATPLALPAELTIYAVAELHPQWLAWLAALDPHHDAAHVDASAVDQVDGAGLQLLLSLQRALEARTCRLRLHGPSEALRQGCAAMGLGDWMHQHLPEGAAA